MQVYLKPKEDLWSTCNKKSVKPKNGATCNLGNSVARDFFEEFASPSSIGAHSPNRDIVDEYMRRGDRANPTEEDSQKGKMQAYLKPKKEDWWLTGDKKSATPKNGAKYNSGNSPAQDSNRKLASPASCGAHTLKHVAYKGKQGFQKAKKGGKGISLTEAVEDLVVFPRSGPCNCQAARHQLINNCLFCGKVVCEQEGEYPCSFCGSLVLKEGSNYAGLEGLEIPLASEAESAANEFKNRLV